MIKERRKINIVLGKAELDKSMHGMCATHNKDQYFILINDQQTKEEQAAAFLHECLHIYHNDFESTLSVNEIEALRHEELFSLLKILIMKEGR